MSLCFDNIPCDQIVDLGCVGHCDPVALGSGLPNGNYVVRALFGDTIRYIHTDETLTINPATLPMNKEILLSVKDFDDERVLFDDMEYLKITFKYQTDETI
jgi:hypothetical protein